jgi:hypothetical protein
LVGQADEVNLTCNIDRRGRVTRIVTGSIVDVCGAALVVTGVLTGERAMIIGGAVVSVAGSFMIFEGAKGWCALRALGMKTPL